MTPVIFFSSAWYGGVGGVTDWLLFFHVLFSQLFIFMAFSMSFYYVFLLLIGDTEGLMIGGRTGLLAWHLLDDHEGLVEMAWWTYG